MAAPMKTWGRFCRMKFFRNLHNKIRCIHSNPWTNEERYSALVELVIGDRTLQIGSGKLARFADGSAVVQHGDTSVLVTAVGNKKPNPSSPPSFLPLTVDYRQKAAAFGRIPTNYFRRELGPSEKEILTSRMIDRSVRPLFPDGYLCDTQIMCNLLVVDGVNDPDVLSINAASAALALSDIPWDGPVAAVRVGYVNNAFVINPTRLQQQESLLNLIITCTEEEKIVMIEASAEQLPTDIFQSAIEQGVKETQAIIEQIKVLQRMIGKTKREFRAIDNDEHVLNAANSLVRSYAEAIFQDVTHDKFSRDRAIQKLKRNVSFILQESFPNIDPSVFFDACDILIKQVFRDLILERNIRCDGRALTDIRPISCNIDLYKPLHGSALFQRGQTQVLCTCTFDSLDSAAKADSISVLTGGLKEKNFMLHYEFPPYATNETKAGAATSRRELGHGALAEKGLRPVVPTDYPFTIRLTSEVLESNGSSSMASICGGSLALMDAGVPISNAAAGVAIGLITRMTRSDPKKIEDYRILTDILGIEDYMGDMDFKMAGTKDGVTALQADIKLPGVPKNIILDAVSLATDAKNKILDIMSRTIKEPRPAMKACGPVTEELEVPIFKRHKFIGIGGYNLKKITSETGVRITAIDETRYQLFAPNRSAMDEAKQMIDNFLTEEPAPELVYGGIYSAKITEIRDIGVMVQLHPKLQPALLHNSQLDIRKVNHPSALDLKVGQEIMVKYFDRDPVKGTMRLSRKVLQSLGPSAVKDLNRSMNK